MIVPLLIGFLADLVFESVAAMRSSFTKEMDRHLDQRGFRPAPPEQAPAR